MAAASLGELALDCSHGWDRYQPPDGQGAAGGASPHGGSGTTGGAGGVTTGGHGGAGAEAGAGYCWPLGGQRSVVARGAMRVTFRRQLSHSARPRGTLAVLFAEEPPDARVVAHLAAAHDALRPRT